MPRRNLLALATLLSALCAGSVVRAEPDGQDPNRCAHLEGKPVYKKGGFSHVVRVRNTCTEGVTCEVWTNVDEQKVTTISVPASSQREASLRDGSPVSLFRVEGKCSF